MKALSRFLQSIACLWLAVGFAMPLQGGIFINSYRFSSTGGPTAFLATVNNSSAGFTLPLVSGSTYDFYVDWGDGSAVDHITTWNQAQATHNYPTSGSYQMSITGTMPRWYFNSGGSKDKLLSIDSWGPMVWTNFDSAFLYCTNLTSIASDGNFSSVTSFAQAFWGCSSLTSFPSMDLPACTTCYGAWANCPALVSVGAVNAPNSTSYWAAFYGCSALTTIGAVNMSSATDIPLVFTGPNLTSLGAIGIRESFTAGSSMNAAALNALMTNLATVTSKTITISSNPGYATCTPSIATSKGWTVN